MQVPKPQLGPFSINLNSVLVVVGFAFTWGMTYQALESGRESNTKDIRRIEERLTTLETTGRILDNHEMRISTVEVNSRDAAAALRAVESSLNSLATDGRVMREIMQRIEAAQSGGAERGHRPINR